ncbi:MAG TPA: N-acetyltransferase [Nitrososphaerales archaeon]|nr:N-acetyltransferase [Nitrososphaerales archaeon]
MIEVKVLSPERWMEARELRLKALKTDPTAFGSSYEEEESLSETEWRRRMWNALFAVADDKPVGSITYLFSDKVKSRHIARIYGVYVDPDHRRQGIGKKLLQSALDGIRENKNAVKVQLMVNKEQHAAVKLYEDLGFLTVGQLKKEIKVGERYYDELIMEKML